MGITTKGGDSGETSLYSGERVKKSHLIMETIGTIDELNSWLGLVKSKVENKIIKGGIEEVQLVLFTICSTVATKEDSDFFNKIEKVNEKTVVKLDEFEEKLLKIVKMPDKFIIPGENENSAKTDIARTVCRRAERRLVQLSDIETNEKKSNKTYKFEKKFVNRLSDVLFIIARYFEEGEFKEK